MAITKKYIKIDKMWVVGDGLKLGNVKYTSSSALITTFRTSCLYQTSTSFYCRALNPRLVESASERSLLSQALVHNFVSCIHKRSDLGLHKVIIPLGSFTVFFAAVQRRCMANWFIAPPATESFHENRIRYAAMRKARKTGHLSHHLVTLYLPQLNN